jgi:hypothetical protein
MSGCLLEQKFGFLTTASFVPIIWKGVEEEVDAAVTKDAGSCITSAVSSHKLLPETLDYPRYVREIEVTSPPLVIKFLVQHRRHVNNIDMHEGSLSGFPPSGFTGSMHQDLACVASREHVPHDKGISANT